MDTHHKKVILEIARAAVTRAIGGDPLHDGAADDLPVLDEHRGLFVTLKTNGRLRGCLGRFEANTPLRELLPEIAADSAMRDPRFAGDRITLEELDDLKIEVSLLSPLAKTDNPLSIVLGVHGIYIRKGAAAGCFLPQVAEEAGWTKEEFLSNCASHKAGLPPDAWKDPDTEVLVFTAEVFCEDDN